MRYWRSIGLLVLALGVLALPAHAANKKKPAAPKHVAAAKPEAKPAAADSAKVAKVKAKSPRKHRDPWPERRAWMIGFGYGYGGASFHGVGTGAFITHPPRSAVPFPPVTFSSKSREWSSVNQFRIGYAIRPGLAVGFERSDWTKELSGNQWRFGLSAITYTWFPGTKYLYVKAGGGVADASDHDKIDSAAHTILYADDGFGALVGVGLEHHFYKRISIAAQVQATYMSISPKIFADYGAAGLSFNWWF